jgi:hypothetical protein
MSLLNNFAKYYDNAYQDTFFYALVAREVANTRFEPTLTRGESVTRIKFDISNVSVRDTVRHSDSTIDVISDTEDTLLIDREKEMAFRMADGEVTQALAGAMQTIGSDVARKLAADLDHWVFSKVVDSSIVFDAGDLTTLANTGASITLNGTTVPQMASRLPAKLARVGKQTLSGLILVVDAYGASDITQYLMGKDIDLAGSAFRNGYAGVITPMSGATVYVSEHLLGEARLVVDVATADETISVMGVTFTAKAVPANPGEFDIGADADIQGATIANMINGSATGKDSATGYFEVSAANRKILNDAQVRAVFTAATDVLQVFAAGRLVWSTTMSGTTSNRLHAYFGKRGGIDLVVQDMKTVDIRQESRQRASVLFSSYLAGAKVFPDAAQTFIDLHITA